MADRITISNFGGIHDASFTLNEINVFIGEQATGKSVAAMLIWFCRNIPKWLVENWTLKNHPHSAPNKHLENLFTKYFPPSNYPLQGWSVEFENDFYSVQIQGSAAENPLTITTSESLAQITDGITQIIQFPSNPQQLGLRVEEFWKQIRESFHNKENIFIPAGRSNFYQIKSNTFSFLSGQTQIPPLILEFGAYFEQKVVQRLYEWDTSNPSLPNVAQFGLPFISLFESIVRGKYHQDQNQEEFIIHPDHRKVSLFNASSGQQELMPLAHTLLDLIYSRINDDNDFHCYIEEPETHLFPTGQATVAKMIATTYNSRQGNHHFVITTHSPYFLSALNNLIAAGMIRAAGNVAQEDLEMVVPGNIIVPPGKVSAFLFENGKVISIMDEETGLVLASSIDGISDKIGGEFDQLLELKYAHS